MMLLNNKWRKYSPLLISVFSLFSLTLSAQKLSIETQIDTNTIVLGEQIGLNYIINKKNDIHLNIPNFTDTLTDGVEIIGEPLIDSSKIDKETQRINIKLNITAFDTGMYYIPPQAISFSDANFSDTLFSRPTYIEVRGVAIDTTNTVRDIKAPERVPVNLAEVVLYTVPVILLAVLVYLLIVYFRKRKKEEPIFKPAKPEEPPYITALRELDKLKAQKLWQQNKVKEYYSSITRIVRWYIEKRFSIPALEQVSDEILEHIKTQRIDNLNYTNLEQLLNLADLVKFARGNPEPDENITHLENAYAFIKQSRENEQPGEQEENKAVEE